MTTATATRPAPTKHAPITGACVWTGKEIEKSDRWIRDLTPAHLAELDKALQGVKAKGLDWSQVTKENFPLSSAFDELLDSIREELENGSGILKLRGWPVTKYDEADLRRMYNGFAKHLATPVFQNRSGEMMRAIRDEGAHVGKTYGETKDKQGGTFLSSYARTLSSGELRFHTDRTDVVGLLCVRQARAGGVSKLASSPAIHNAMLATRPDLVDELYQDIWRSRFGEEATTKETAYPLPIWGVRDGKFTSHYSQTFVDAAQLSTNGPKLTPKQDEALTLLRKLAQDLCMEMVLDPGDLQLINSHVTYHGRTAFEDNAATGNDRLLLRLWLCMPNNRALPKGHEILWQQIDAGKLRGGIQQITI